MEHKDILMDLFSNVPEEEQEEIADRVENESDSESEDEGRSGSKSNGKGGADFQFPDHINLSEKNDKK